jgi:transcriptional regulator with XRE-family HTH domain
MHIGEWIRGYREAQAKTRARKAAPKSRASSPHLVQDELAQAVGVTTGTISRWERGLVIPTLQQFKALCLVLKQSPSILAELELERVKPEELREARRREVAVAMFQRARKPAARRKKGTHGHGSKDKRRSAARRNT